MSGEEIITFSSVANHVFLYSGPDTQSRMTADIHDYQKKLICPTVHDMIRLRGTQRGRDETHIGVSNCSGPWFPYIGEYGLWLRMLMWKFSYIQMHITVRSGATSSYQHCSDFPFIYKRCNNFATEIMAKF